MSCSFARWRVAPARLLHVRVHAYFLLLFAPYLSPLGMSVVGKAGWESLCPLGKVLSYKNLIYLLSGTGKDWSVPHTCPSVWEQRARRKSVLQKLSGQQKWSGPSQTQKAVHYIQTKEEPANRVSAGLWLLALNGTTQSQPMPHPSNKIVWRYCETSNDSPKGSDPETLLEKP